MQQKISTIARDENCDLYIDGTRQFAMVYGKDAYAQIINAKMRTALGEMQLAMQKGIPYFQTVFSDKSMLPIWKDEVEKMLRSLSFVKNIFSFYCNYDNDVLKYTVEIETDSGMVEING